MDNEVWRSIPSCPGYEASSEGRVRSPRRILNPYLRGSGYMATSCGSTSGRAIKKLVHILVAEAFYGPRLRGLVVAHKDGNKLNNRAENLQYTTPRANNLHQRQKACPLLSRAIKKRGRPHPPGSHASMKKRSDAQVLEVHRLASEGKQSAEISESMGVPRHWVWHVLAGTIRKQLHPDLSLRR